MKTTLKQVINDYLFMTTIMQDLSDYLNEKVLSSQFKLYHKEISPYILENDTQKVSEKTKEEYNKVFESDYINLYEYFDDTVIYFENNQVLVINVLNCDTNNFEIMFFKRAVK